mmetsp:Transcript_26195/g.39663  ORF Transcript_26195/g.39663 Transcript_26195/m.39663 type:complete len:343 (-) Transcript_26195:53-1081(-)
MLRIISLLLLLAQILCSVSFLLFPFHSICQRTKSFAFHASPRNYEDESPSKSIDFALDPYSSGAENIIQNRLGLTKRQHDKLAKLSELIFDWNQNINLISRRDCTVEVVFGRHVLPSLALLSVDSPFKDGFRVVDVGTGGGFPGLPLAIACPNVDFLLVDSVGKKLNVIEEIAETLALDNVFTHHGRAEEMVDIIASKHRNAYDICVGRSVTSLPRFCFWVQDLLRQEYTDDSKGEYSKVMYIIGGEIEEEILQRTECSPSINDLLQQDGVSDKRILVFPQSEVYDIAALSGEKKKIRKRPIVPNSNVNKSSGKRKTKGAWEKKDNSAPKERGYENFRRYGY